MSVSKKTINGCYTKEDKNVDNTINNYSDFDQSVKTYEDESFEDETKLQKTQEFFDNMIVDEPESKEGKEMPSIESEKYLNEKINRVEQKIDLKDEAINNKIDALIRSTQHYENLMDGHMKEIKEDQREMRKDSSGNFKWTIGIMITGFITIVIGIISLMATYSG